MLTFEFEIWIGLAKRSHQADYAQVPLIAVQGEPSGQRLHFVDFYLGVPPCSLYGMPILPDLQLPKQNKADKVSAKSVIKM